MAALLVLAAGGGCTPGVDAYAPGKRPVIDRRGVEFPAGLELTVAADDLTAATALAVDSPRRGPSTSQTAGNAATRRGSRGSTPTPASWPRFTPPDWPR